MKHARKLTHREGVLKASIGVYHGDDLKTVNAILDTGASRAIVRGSSQYLLNGEDKNKALSDLQFTEDRELFRAAKRGLKVHVKTIHETREASNLGVIRLRLNGANISMLAILADDSNLPPDVELLEDADTMTRYFFPLRKILRTK